jgi:hypothetical protein
MRGGRAASCSSKMTIGGKKGKRHGRSRSHH